MLEPEPSFDEIGEALRRSTVALRDAGVPFVLGGSLASWARGGPQTRHDLDLIVKPADADRALSALDRAGMRTERPAEDWLYKAWHGEVLIDLIFAPSGLEVTDELIERSEERYVLSVPMRVMTLEDLFVTKLCSIDEQDASFNAVIEIARAVREQVDWEAVRAHTHGSAFARAFFVLLEGLGILEAPHAERGERTRITVGPGLAALEGGRERT